MFRIHENGCMWFRIAVLTSISVFLAGCTTSVPKTARVKHADLPNYKVGSHRVEEAIDLHIEPRIQNLRVSVTPRSEHQAFRPIPVLVGPALEQALLSMTRQHFAKITTVPVRDGRPTLSYELLTYKPVVAVVSGILSTRLNVSARLALQVSIHAADGEQLFSTTAIGTSHVSDTTLSAGDGLKDGPRLLEVATRDAIIDAMYAISSIFGNNNEMIRTEVLTSAVDPDLGIETFDDVILNLRTRREEDLEN